MDIDKIRRIQSIYSVVEDRLKITENLTTSSGGISIPVINQLRYAGYHLFRYVLDEDTCDLLEVELHCGRALFDAYEVEAIYYLEVFKKFQEDFHDVPITETVHDYIEWRKAHDNAQLFIRENSQRVGRYKYYDNFKSHIDRLNSIHMQLPYAREEINKKIASLAREEKVSKTAFYIGITSIVITIMLAILLSVEPEFFKKIFCYLFNIFM